MVNPIKTTPFALPAELTTTDLPGTIARAAAPVPPPERSARSGTATGEQYYPDGTTADTPLEKTIEQLNNSMQAWATGMRFEVDDDAQRIVVSIIDSATGDVLRTVPSEAVLRVAKMIVQLQGGAIDTRA